MSAFSYIRSIINLGDNLDLMRCVGSFKTEFIFNTLKDIEGFNANLHEYELMKLIKEIHQIIYDQGDMLFSCNVIDPNGGIYASNNSHIINSKKISFEHAENVLAVVFEDLSNNFKIASLLIGLDAPKSQKYTLKPAFDPFIHGTNSSILSLLPKSNFEIMSPLEMMRLYQAAPMNGELVGGGYNVVTSEHIGKTSFIKISAEGTNSYSLNQVINDYARLNIDANENHIINFHAACTEGFKTSYLNLNLILIYFVRVRQSNASLEQIISPQELELLFAKLEASCQFYYLLELLGSHIYPNVDALNQFRIPHDSRSKRFTFIATDESIQISLAVNNFLTYENIVQKIMDRKLDIRKIVANPSHEQLNKVLELFELPKRCTLKNTYNEVEFDDIKLPLRQCFSLRAGAFKYQREHHERGVFRGMQLNLSGGDNSINGLLTKFIEGRASNQLFFSFHDAAKEHREAVEERIRLFRRLVDSPQIHFQISEVQQYFLERKFPLILFSESEEQISLYNVRTAEYRSNSSLKLGKDIKIIATESNDHRLELLKYLEIHKINNIQVILFDDVHKIKATHQPPSSPQHHNDAIPTLKWMAAKKVPESQAQPIREAPSLFLKKSTSSTELYTEKNLNEVSALLKDAKQYHNIQFNSCCP